MNRRLVFGLVIILAAMVFCGRRQDHEKKTGKSEEIKVLVLMGEWFGDAYFPLKDEIDSRGWTMKRVGVDAEYRGCYNKKRDVILTSDILIRDLKDFNSFDCLIIPSGPQFRKFNEDSTVLEFVKKVHSKGILIASFCTGNLVIKAAELIDSPDGIAWFPPEIVKIEDGIILGPRGGGPPPGTGYKDAPVKGICDAIATELGR